MALKISDWLDRKVYPSFRFNWDNDMFRDLVLKYLDTNKTYLDVGAGRGALKQMDFKGIAGRTFGVDPGEVVKENPYLDEAYVGLGDNMPFFEGNKFDVIASNNVFEHVEHPDAFLSELNRVLKQGGVLIAKTPNKYHYMPALATLLPEKLHDFYHKLKGRPSEDTFPTFYRMNSRSMIRKLANKHGFNVKELILVEGRPEYLRINFIPYLFGIAYEKVINLLKLEDLKIVMFIVLEKKNEADHTGY